ncbi:hypothetical protein ACFFSH_29765 [Streptomyces filamentosus]|uniref:hypothetical protein n=1 Tax=Streptomyces filamentosus TaxID=67294 RepID=UPI0016781B04|nr:hypothetical protein [Streptomyces filamentosus]
MREAFSIAVPMRLAKAAKNRFVSFRDSIFVSRRSFGQAWFIPGKRIPEHRGQAEAAQEIDIQEDKLQEAVFPEIPGEVRT